MTCCFGQEEIKHRGKTHNNVGKLQIAGHLYIFTHCYRNYEIPPLSICLLEKILPHLTFKRFLTCGVILYQLASL